MEDQKKKKKKKSPKWQKQAKQLSKKCGHHQIMS